MKQCCELPQAAIDFTHIPTLMYGIAAIVIMVVLRRINPRIPNVLIAVAITTVLSYFTHFNNDQKVEVSAIQYPGLIDKIAIYNETVGAIESIGNARAAIGLQIDEELSSHHETTTKLIDLQSQVATLTLDIGEAKHASHLIRSELRNPQI